MTRHYSPLESVPTNVITGFLGVGKTTAILHLLHNKPAEQRWAVLVNEFGEIGIDGSILQGHYGEEQQGIYVREVPGGCMCCAAGLPMQIVLNQLLTIAKPDRLLIEPTGLGHPKEILSVLSNPTYRKTLSLQKTITLMNALDIKDSRYTNNEIYNQQLEVADVVIANKVDLYQPQDKLKLQAYVQQHTTSNPEIVFTSNGEIDLSILNGPSQFKQPHTDNSSSHHHAPTSAPNIDPMPECGFVKKQNHGHEFSSVGWRFRNDFIFERNKVFSLLSATSAERLKAILNTDQGIYGYNMVAGTLSEVPLFGGGESCIEVINPLDNGEWEEQLLQCVAESSVSTSLS